MITLDDVKNAYSRIAPYVRRTTVARNHTLSQKLGTNLYLKLELFQKTGSFKPRGAFNKMLRHCDEAREQGVVQPPGAALGIQEENLRLNEVCPADDVSQAVDGTDQIPAAAVDLGSQQVGL